MIAHHQECNPPSADLQRCHGRRRAARRGLESRSREILICYSVCLWRDEKHSFANPLEEKHIGGGLVALLVGMAAESCLAAHRQTELLSALKACMFSDSVQREGTRSPKKMWEKKPAFMSLIRHRSGK